MLSTMSTTTHPERFTFPRLLIRAALLGATVPVMHESDFGYVKLIQILAALLLCVVLYGVEMAALYAVRGRISIKPYQSAGYRGGLLGGLLSLLFFGDWVGALGASIPAALIAMLLFGAENSLIKWLFRTPVASVPVEKD